MKAEAFAILANEAPYQKLKAADICTCEYREDDSCGVEFSSGPAESVTAEQWDEIQRIKALLPGSEVRLFWHQGEGQDCENLVTAYSYEVKIQVGSYEFVKHLNA